MTIGGMLVLLAILFAAKEWSRNPASGDSHDQQTVVESTDAVDWRNVAAKVNSELQERDLLQWSDGLAANLAAADAETLQVAVEVFRRAGQPQRMTQAIAGLGKLEFASRDGSDGEMTQRLLELGWYDQARAWFDTFPQRGPALPEIHGFVRWLVEKEGVAGARDWLRDKARQEESPSGLQRGNWSRFHWQLLADDGELANHVDALAERIKQNPADADLVFEYVGARLILPEQQRRPAVWLAESSRLERALHNFALGQMFRLYTPEATILFYDRSLACPVTDYDRQHFNEFSGWAMYVPPEEAERRLRSAVKAGLAEACFRVKNLDRAQELVEELTSKQGGELEDLAPFLLAGQVQAASGQRAVEGRIKQAEEENKDSILYWLNRAKYYCGRNEMDKADEAYQAALKLPEEPENSWHFDAVRDYGWFLVGQERFADANRVYRDELKRIGPKAPQANFWLNRLQFQVDPKGGERLKWNEPLVWDWLAAQKNRFGQEAQRRLVWVAKRAGNSDEFEKQALALAAEPRPAQLQFCLGDIFRGRGKAQAGVSMMAEAYARSPRTEWPGDPRGAAQLFRAQLGQGDLAAAEKLLDRLMSEPGYGDNPYWLDEFSLVAARNRAPELAMRLWRAKANMDLTDQVGLDDLAASGLGDRLRDYYTALAKRAPKNAFVTVALRQLARP